jgi:signal transduction histidine kinase
MSKDGSKYYYYQPIRASNRMCLDCHQPMSTTTGDTTLRRPVGGNSGAEAVGQFMAVARLTFPTDVMRKSINEKRAILIADAIITVFLAMVASYAIVRYVIVKPLRHLRDVSDAVSRGNTTLRAEIRTGDEFEELAVAFNRMLRHLIAAQEELRHANVSLDGKVDELAQANMRLYELNMLKSDFLATMSHELRTPLNSILGFSEVLGSIDALEEKQKRYVQNIQKSGKTLLEMINDILDLAKIESGKMETRLSDFAIAQVVAAQCDMARPLTERKNIDLECCLDAELPPMHQDQARVQQILNNLLSNAIKFTPEGGRITVTARRDPSNFLVLTVSDTGVGIAPEDQLTIFEKFRQGRTAMPSGDAMTREYSGSGLGLSIVKELCRLLGGEVALESELGKGSVFTVRLPWILEDQPRLDAALVEGFEEFTKQRFETGGDSGAAEPSDATG